MGIGYTRLLACVTWTKLNVISAVSVYTLNFAISFSYCLHAALPYSLSNNQGVADSARSSLIFFGLSCVLLLCAAHLSGICELKLCDVFMSVNCELQNNSVAVRWHIRELAKWKTETAYYKVASSFAFKQEFSLPFFLKENSVHGNELKCSLLAFDIKALACFHLHA